MYLNLIIKDQIIHKLSVHTLKKIVVYKDMNELSNKDKEDAKYSEKRKKLIKTLMEVHFQNNVIRFTLTNILTVDEKNYKEKKDDVKFRTY